MILGLRNAIALLNVLKSAIAQVFNKLRRVYQHLKEQ